MYCDYCLFNCENVNTHSKMATCVMDSDTVSGIKVEFRNRKIIRFHFDTLHLDHTVECQYLSVM